MTTFQTTTAPFGTAFAATMATTYWRNGDWDSPRFGPLAPFSFHPATHALHYASACFEGLKAHLGADGSVRIFRLGRHVERMQQSAELLWLPVPPAEMLTEMITEVVAACRYEVPEAPGSLYLRPTLLGVEPNIGAAGAPSKEALLYVFASPVGDYFAGGVRPLKIKVETEHPRTTPMFGRVKAGANYVMALGITQMAKRELGIDQVLFAPGGIVQETGASNFLILDDEKVITAPLDESFLHGVTRDSILHLARDLGYGVEERLLTVDEVLSWADHGEAALSGTAAVLAPVGTLIHDGIEYTVGGGVAGKNTLRLRKALTDLHAGVAADTHGWTTLV
ncbi:MAG: branched-chain-amino-acid transaminase [Acidimicrobiia bacterium]|nr:branched-chain-amino-acid transaminase [Acidimicrobiia bacterium]